MATVVSPDCPCCGPLSGSGSGSSGSGSGNSGAEQYCANVPYSSLPDPIYYTLSTTSAAAAPGIDGQTGPMAKNTGVSNWESGNIILAVGTPPYANQKIYLRCCPNVGPQFGLYVLSFFVDWFGSCPIGEGVGVEFSPVSSTPSPWSLTFDVPVCYFGNQTGYPGDRVRVVVSE
jgi:hypothetical protein